MVREDQIEYKRMKTIVVQMSLVTSCQSYHLLSKGNRSCNSSEVSSVLVLLGTSPVDYESNNGDLGPNSFGSLKKKKLFGL